jgi:hypothetical protein
LIEGHPAPATVNIWPELYGRVVGVLQGGAASPITTTDDNLESDTKASALGCRLPVGIASLVRLFWPVWARDPVFV